MLFLEIIIMPKYKVAVKLRKKLRNTNEQNVISSQNKKIKSTYCEEISNNCKLVHISRD